MNIYYLKPTEISDKATDVICAIIDLNCYCILFDFITQSASFEYLTLKRIHKMYINNPEYQLINSSVAKEQIKKNKLAKHIPAIQLSLSFEIPLPFHETNYKEKKQKI